MDQLPKNTQNQKNCAIINSQCTMSSLSKQGS